MRSVVRTQDDLIAFIAKVTDKLGADLGGKPYTVSIRRFYRPKTNQQNRYFHALIAELADFCGYSPKALKDAIKAEHGIIDTVQIGNQIMNRPRSIADYKIDELGYMIDRVLQLGGEVGCVFQEPQP